MTNSKREHARACQILHSLDELCSAQALAVDAKQKEKVLALTGEIEALIKELEPLLSAMNSLPTNDELHQVAASVWESKKLCQARLRDALAQLAAQRNILAHCGVQWYGDQSPKIYHTNAFDLSM